MLRAPHFGSHSWLLSMSMKTSSWPYLCAQRLATRSALWTGKGPFLELRQIVVLRHSHDAPRDAVSPRSDDNNQREGQQFVHEQDIARLWNPPGLWLCRFPIRRHASIEPDVQRLDFGLSIILNETYKGLPLPTPHRL